MAYVAFRYDEKLCFCTDVALLCVGARGQLRERHEGRGAPEDAPSKDAIDEGEHRLAITADGGKLLQ